MEKEIEPVCGRARLPPGQILPLCAYLDRGMNLPWRGSDLAPGRPRSWRDPHLGGERWTGGSQTDSETVTVTSVFWFHALWNLRITTQKGRGIPLRCRERALFFKKRHFLISFSFFSSPLINLCKQVCVAMSHFFFFPLKSTWFLLWAPNTFSW